MLDVVVVDVINILAYLGGDDLRAFLEMHQTFAWVDGYFIGAVWLGFSLCVEIFNVRLLQKARYTPGTWFVAETAILWMLALIVMAGVILGRGWYIYPLCGMLLFSLLRLCTWTKHKQDFVELHPMQTEDMVCMSSVDGKSEKLWVVVLLKGVQWSMAFVLVFLFVQWEVAFQIPPTAGPLVVTGVLFLWECWRKRWRKR